MKKEEKGRKRKKKEEKEEKESSSLLGIGEDPCQDYAHHTCCSGQRIAQRAEGVGLLN